jgi:hypothetical protein
VTVWSTVPYDPALKIADSDGEESNDDNVTVWSTVPYDPALKIADSDAEERESSIYAKWSDQEGNEVILP